MAVEPQSEHHVAVAGREHLLAVWDLGTTQRIFQSRNVCSASDTLSLFSPSCSSFVNIFTSVPAVLF
jgi:hypothetical protein